MGSLGELFAARSAIEWLDHATLQGREAHFAFARLGSDVSALDEHADIIGVARHRNLATVEERLRVPQLRFDGEIASLSPEESMPNGRRS
jgi:hypothetical protein